MKVLVLGGGGREHALVWKLRQSPRVREVLCAPGNAGIAQEATCHPVDINSVDALVELALRVKPELTVVGPEVPLMLGVVDEFRQRGLPIFGPTRAAAQLESSKIFAKEFMQRLHIPTARYVLCTDVDQVKGALEHFHAPVVVKADGLAAGKGVIIAQTKEEADAVAHDMLLGKIVGEAGRKVVLEECVQGDEISFLVLSDGEHVAPLVAAQDHKRVNDGDNGPNTGGMGACSTDQLLDASMRAWLITHIAQPVIDGMRQEGNPYVGILYCGLMMTAIGPQVLEFNCRFGDPETQPILMRLESDLLDAFEAGISGRVHEDLFTWSDDATACVVMASGGYPGKYESGKPIRGLDAAAKVEGSKIFHAGTAMRDGEIVTAGGRVLGVTARGADLRLAVDRAYEAAACIQFQGAHYRRDIAHRGLMTK